MNVTYHNRNPLPESMSGEARWVSFEELLHMSDVLGLNVLLKVRNSIHTYASFRCPNASWQEKTYHKVSY